MAVFCTYLLGALLHSRTAGVVASALLATSPIFLFQIVQPMSDVPAAAWWTLAFLFACSSLPNAALAAGATAGLAVLTRPNLAPLGLIVALCAAWRPEASGGRTVPTGRGSGHSPRALFRQRVRSCSCSGASTARRSPPATGPRTPCSRSRTSCRTSVRTEPGWCRENRRRPCSCWSRPLC